MMNRALSAGAMVFGLVLVASCASPPTEEAAMNPGWRAVQATIARRWREHIDAGIAKDLPGVLDIYTEDALYAAPGGQELRGIAEIEARERATMERFTVLSAVHSTLSLNVDGDRAYELGVVIGPIREGDRRPEEVTWHFMAYWQRDPDDQWRIAYLVGRAGSSRFDRFR